MNSSASSQTWHGVPSGPASLPRRVPRVSRVTRRQPASLSAVETPRGSPSCTARTSVPPSASARLVADAAVVLLNGTSTPEPREMRVGGGIVSGSSTSTRSVQACGCAWSATTRWSRGAPSPRTAPPPGRGSPRPAPQLWWMTMLPPEMACGSAASRSSEAPRRLS
jgi:hypothetical protein